MKRRGATYTFAVPADAGSLLVGTTATTSIPAVARVEGNEISTLTYRPTISGTQLQVTITYTDVNGVPAGVGPRPRADRARPTGQRPAREHECARGCGPMDVYEALYTTRAMRRVPPDPIPIDVQQRILDAAIRAPSGGNMQNWRFLLVDDPDVMAQLGPDLPRRAWRSSGRRSTRTALDAANADPDEPENAQFLRMQRSAQHLADHFEEYPLLLFSFVQFDPTGGSIHPATWSAMLAARAEGVGSSLTSVFMFQIDEVLEILGVPGGRGLALLVVRHLRLPDRALGRRAPPAGPRGLVPQPLGHARRLRDPGAALERLIRTGTSLRPNHQNAPAPSTVT